jgi:hypothetical protein
MDDCVLAGGARDKEGRRMNDPKAPGGVIKRYYGGSGRGQTYLNFIYLVLGLPIGIAYFVILVTALATFGGLAITLVGIPLLLATMYGWCVLAGFERVQTNILLGTGINPLPFAREPGEYWQWRRIKARMGNTMTWRALGFLLLRFPIGIATFVIAVTLVATPLGMLAMPIISEFGSGANFGFWQVDTVWKGLLFVVPGLLLLPLALYLCNALAALCGRLTRMALDTGNPPEGSPQAVDRAVNAAITWRGLSLDRTVATEHAHQQRVQLKVFGVHAAVFAAISLFLVILNGLASPGTWWSIWPVWGLAIVLGAHAGYLLKGLLGLHALVFAVVNLGLFVIDATYTGGKWFYYPLLGWGALLLAHAYGAHRLVGGVTERARTNWQSNQAFEAIGQRSEPGTSAGVAGGCDDAPEPAFSEAAPLSSPSISVDVVMRVVRVGGRPVELTPKEFDLLALFAQNPGRPFSREELLDRIWKNDYEVTDRTIDTHVQRLRKKLGEQSEAIQTVWGVGYKFQSIRVPSPES